MPTPTRHTSRSTPRARRPDPIYVEAHIAAPIERVWQLTQDPAQHQRWDLRFTSIEYCTEHAGIDDDGAEHAGADPGDHEPKLQHFRYATTLVPGLTVTGWGETIGERRRDGASASSTLDFGSSHRLSLIRRGSGFWRYVPTENGVRFLTRFDYSVRWGRAGRLVDRLFRPLFGWGTAWSFDRLRLWIEHGVTPERSRNQALANSIAVAGVAGVWVYHGLVPKLIAPEAGELDLLTNSIAWLPYPRAVLSALGLAEIAAGLALVRWRQRRWPFLLTLAAMPPLTLGALAGDAAAFVRPFSPVTLNLAVMALAAIALLTSEGLPSATNTRRTPAREGA